MKTKAQPMRTCVGCGQSFVKKDLRRIAMNAEGQIHIDPTGKAPGRGAYICPKLDCLEAAYKGRKLERSFRGSVSKEIYEALRTELSHE
jgi:Predicted nucleic-acid-binding protein implicated in transcription termination